jgi:hypothetical protein
MSLQILCTKYFKLLQFATLQHTPLQYRANQSAATQATESVSHTEWDLQGTNSEH